MGSMITAIQTVHAKNGPWNADGGYECNLALIAATFGIVDAGPGPLSIDRSLGIHDTGPGWALASLAAAARASLLTIQAGGREPDTQAAAPKETSSESSA
jgi:putative oxidoreductase